MPLREDVIARLDESCRRSERPCAVCWVGPKSAAAASETGAVGEQPLTHVCSMHDVTLGTRPALEIPLLVSDCF